MDERSINRSQDTWASSVPYTEGVIRPYLDNGSVQVFYFSRAPSDAPTTKRGAVNLRTMESWAMNRSNPGHTSEQSTPVDSHGVPPTLESLVQVWGADLQVKGNAALGEFEFVP